MPVAAFEDLRKRTVVPSFEALRRAGSLSAPLDVAELETDQFPEDLRPQADRMRNAYIYVRDLGIGVDEAYDYEPQINEALYGAGTTSTAAWKLTRNKIADVRRKSIGEAFVHGVGNQFRNVQKLAAGFGRMVAETEALAPKMGRGDQGLGLADPAFRWLFGVPKDVDVAKFMADLSDAVSADIKASQAEHPEMGFAIDADAGFVETLKQMVTRPENMIQGLTESVPMILEGVLGNLVAGPVGGVLAIGIPLSGAIYQTARADGTDVLPAFAQAVATAGLEAAIEQWTLGRKIALGKNITRILSEKPGRKLLWEGVKAGFRGGAEEGSQQFNENFWRWVFTDRSQKWFDGVSQAAAMGTPLEMVMSGAFAGVGKIGASVSVEEANRRLDILRKGVRESDLNVGQKEELLAQMDRVPQIVPDIFGIEETEDGTATGQTPAPGTEPQTAGPGQGPAAVAERVAEIEDPDQETTEEARIADARLTAEGAETVEPKLYIGNITARMREAMAQAAGVSPSEIGTFREGAWPTKRTKIPMTRVEAEEYLGWLEADLQRRLDENLIRTHDDMATANADWGDIKTLRRVLGVEEQMQAAIKQARRESIELRRQLKRAEKAAPSGTSAARIAELKGQLEQRDRIIRSAGRPWYIVYAQGQGQVVRDQGELLAAKRELAGLRRELAATKDVARQEELEDALMAQTLLVDRLQRALGKAPKVLKTVAESIYGGVQPSRLQESNMTVQEVLRATLKRSERYAKMGYQAGRRELRAQMQAKEVARRRLRAALARIRAKVPSTVDVVYRNAIAAIKHDLDPTVSGGRQRQQGPGQEVAEFLRGHPELADVVPSDVLGQVAGKSKGEYTIGQLEAVADAIGRLRDAGSLERRMEILSSEQNQRRILDELAASSTPITDREMMRPEAIGEQLSWRDRARNTLSRMLNTAAQKWRAVATPMDVFFDMLDGTKDYQGPNSRIFKQTLDTAYGRYLSLRDEMEQDVVRLAHRMGLQRGNYERIGVHAALQQENGREKLLATGHTEAQIDAVRLTDEEMQIYELMREKLDDLAPAIADVMEVVYNAPFTEVKNYFSFMTDFEAMSDYEIREMYGDRVQEFSTALKKNVEHGFAITRTGAPQKIKINALEIFRRHIDNATYLVEMGADIKRLSDLAGTPEYGQAVGARGQEEVRSWLDLMARKGGVERNKTIPLLDVFRKHTGAAVLGWKVSTAVVNITPLLDGAGLIGRYAWNGASAVATDARWRQFLLENLPELRNRVGGDIDFREFGGTGLERVETLGFYVLQKIDGIAASSVAAGAYMKYLDEHGLGMTFEQANADAVAYAQRVMRRSQASGFYKDLPSAFTRGTFTGNKSVDRLLLQFQTFIMNRWSMIEHDMVRSGIATGNVGRAMNIFLWLALAGFAEMGLRRATKELIAMLTGEELEDWPESFTEELVTNTLQNVPFVSQGVSVHQYGQVPVPTLSLLDSLGGKYMMLKRTKDPDKKTLYALELLIVAGGTAAGLPGTMQVEEIVRSIRRQEKPHSPSRRRLR